MVVVNMTLINNEQKTHQLSSDLSIYDINEYTPRSNMYID